MRQTSIFKAGVFVRLRVWPRLSALALAALWTAGMPSAAYAQFGARDRILEPVDASRWSAMRGNVRPAARPESDLGELPPATRLGRVTMFFSRTPQQEADLQALLQQQQDRGSANYHRWLTPEEFADRFGLSQSDVDKVIAWLQGQGLTIEQMSRSRAWVAFSGTAQQMEAALRTDLRRYAVGGETHFAMGREPSLPSALAGVVLGFRGLDDFRMKPRTKRLQPRLTSGVTGNHFLAPGDVATIYNLGALYATADGTGQTIAVAGQTDINLSDVQIFRSLSGLAPNTPQKILVPQTYSGDTGPGMVAADIDEAYLDVEWTGAVARNATIKYVYSKSVLDAFTYIVDLNLAPVLSISYGLCEGGTDGFTQSDANVLSSIAQQANAKGITIVAPSGDSGASDCDSDVPARQGLAVDLPGALPYVTSVGGTAFSGDIANPNGYWAPWTPGTDVVNTALLYIPETSWNDTGLSGVNGIAATGGGSSIYFAKPSWQTGTGVPKDGARDVPDVSFNASSNHDGYLICSEDNTSGTFQPTCVSGFRDAPPPNGIFSVVGGTSVGVPIFAGTVALINQVAGTPGGQGNVNPHLYAMAAASPLSFFHDVTTGNNKVSYQPSTLANCTPPVTSIGYVAGTGYDLVTGLGSIDVYSLVSNWTSISPPAPGPDLAADFQLSISPSSLTVKRSACGTVQLVVTQASGFVGTPVFTSSFASSSLLPFRQEPIVPWGPMSMVVLVVGFCFAIILLWNHVARGQKRLWRGAWAPGFALTCLLALAIGCGGGGSSPFATTSPSNAAPVALSFSVSPIPSPPSNYALTVNVPSSSGVGKGTVTVTGMAGGVTRTTTLSLTVTN